jgi:hypothetical protein
MPYMFGTDFMLAELQVYALAKKWMPEYEVEFWHLSAYRRAAVT